MNPFCYIYIRVGNIFSSFIGCSSGRGALGSACATSPCQALSRAPAMLEHPGRDHDSKPGCACRELCSFGKRPGGFASGWPKACRQGGVPHPSRCILLVTCHPLEARAWSHVHPVGGCGPCRNQAYMCHMCLQYARRQCCRCAAMKKKTCLRACSPALAVFVHGSKMHKSISSEMTYFT